MNINRSLLLFGSYIYYRITILDNYKKRKISGEPFKKLSKTVTSSLPTAKMTCPWKKLWLTGSKTCLTHKCLIPNKYKQIPFPVIFYLVIFAFLCPVKQNILYLQMIWNEMKFLFLLSILCLILCTD